MVELTEVEMLRRQRISQTMKEKYSTVEGKLELSRRGKQRYANQSERVKTSQANLKRYEDPEERLKTSISTKAFYDNPKNSEIVSKSRSNRNKTMWSDENYKVKMTKVLKESSIKNWKTPELIKRMTNLDITKMNGLEEKFYNHVSDKVYFTSGTFWKVLDTGKRITPDFKVIGQNKVIELFGDYWHKGENPEIRISQWRSVGYDCIVFWEHEVYSSINEVLIKLNNYIKDIV